MKQVSDNIFVGNTRLHPAPTEAQGGFVDIDGERFYEIRNFDAMQPFFISLASDTDLWMYIASTGSLTAGRRNPDMALFPYYTDDKITESSDFTGSRTLMRVTVDGNVYLWEPFSCRNRGLYDVCRTIAKSVVGNRLVFTETNHTLGLVFSYTWCSADRYGWIRKAKLTNLAAEPREVEILDGMQNLLPAGIDRLTQNVYSTLVDAYKRTERVGGSSLLLLRMEAIMVDRAEPSESLRCNTVYTLGMPFDGYLLSSAQLEQFRRGAAVVPETVSKGVRCAVLGHAHIALQPGEAQTWYFVADVEKDAVEVRNLLHFSASEDAVTVLEDAIAASTATLRSIVAQNDGVQHTADEHDMARHFANTLFNTMRGGFYCDTYNIRRDAFRRHVALFNRAVAERHSAFLDALPETLAYADLQQRVSEQGDEQLQRLFMEYLPITFSRRHGDPSRPWNMFDIRVNDAEGNRLISYQGNWRDIFQNWEALSLSYPCYINAIISKFLNATTVDGYNPYKITSEGIDWEVIEPDNPWSNIGYWGDHQIVYLLKLLELSRRHDPAALDNLLLNGRFAFANVPYRLKSYQEIVADPKNTVRFDDTLHRHIFSLIPAYGQDARLVLDAGNRVYLTSCTDKLAVTLLAKLSNFIPDAGIWMNTLRPEWNDANNALVGCGASMVTLCYMRRFVAFLQEIYTASKAESFAVSAEIAAFVKQMHAVFLQYANTLQAGFSPNQRRAFVDALGMAGQTYREKAYAGFSGQTVMLAKADWLAFLQQAETYIDASVRAARRADGLYHAYNLVAFGADTLQVSPLYEMLEGQVAVLTSFALSPREVADLLDAMRRSALYRADQNSYMLYPVKQLPSFLDKNNLPAEDAASPLVQRLLKNAKGVIVDRDTDGGVHFNGGFNNASFLSRAIDALPEPLSAEERRQLLDIYERMFRHRAFTGRSGTFYKYEGLGSIYWHMVSKLLLAVGENISRAVEQGTDHATLQRLKDHYWEIRRGIGSHKTPCQYGSFPFDAYSHTPMYWGPDANRIGGVQQPGMTGQVKEDIINRFFELGVQVHNGDIHINTAMLRPEEFLDGELSFTYCAVPFLYRLGTDKGIEVQLSDCQIIKLPDYTVPAEVAHHIFERDNVVKQIIVTL